MLRLDAQHLDLDAPFRKFKGHGYARLGRVLTDLAASELAERAQHMMEDDEPVVGVFYQHDSPSGRYEDLAFNEGWVGPSPSYRKLERLERDPMFRAWIENPLFKRIATSLLGDGVLLYRTVLWNKAPHAGMATPWHQDDGRFWGLDRPLI